MAKQGMHVNLYRLSDGTWRCDLKLNTNAAGEGVTIRGTSESGDGSDPQLGWIPLAIAAAQYGPQIAKLIQAEMKRRKKTKPKRDDDDDDSISGAGQLSRPGRALAAARTIAGAMLGAAQQALPSYVMPTLEVLKALEVAERKGMLPMLRKQLTDPTLRKVAGELDQMQQGKRTAMSGGGCCLADGERGAAMRGPRSFNSLAGMPGNPHPFSSDVANRMDRALRKDPLALQKMARAMQLQRERARQGG